MNQHLRLLICLVPAIAACAGVAPPKPPEAIPAVEGSHTALPGVVLVLAYRPDGRVGYGSGVLLAAQGEILTNKHVVEGARRLAVMFYDPTRPSYVPGDGGLGRYLFENERAIEPAALLRDSEILDLALLRTDANTAPYPKIRWRQTEARVGEHVFAVGHPGEAVWSLSAGLISAMHSALLQTDAAINIGNSGGPLVDVQGEMVGLNTSRLIGEIDGVGFARPVSLLQAFVSDAPLSLDMSTPRAASLTCARAVEMALPWLSHCLSAEDNYDVQYTAQTRLAALLALPAEAESVLLMRRDAIPRATWVALYNRLLLSFIVTSDVSEVSREGEALVEAKAPITAAFKELVRRHLARPEVQSRLAGLSSSRERLIVERAQREERLTGRKPSADGPDIRGVVRMGTRVDEVFAFGDGEAWVLTAGRNLDGSSFRESEYMVRDHGSWEPRLARKGALDHLPPDWPPDTAAFDDLVAFETSSRYLVLLKQIESP